MITRINGKTYKYDYKTVAIKNKTIKIVKKWLKKQNSKLSFMEAMDVLIKKGAN